MTTTDTNVQNLIINKLTKTQYEEIQDPDPTQLYFTTDEVISSSDVVAALGYTPYNGTTNPNGYSSRNLGEIVTSVLPLSDNKLHLLDGSLLTNTNYSDFVDYVSDVYENTTPESQKRYNIQEVGTLTKNNYVISGFSASNYAKVTKDFDPSSNLWEIVLKVKIPTSSALGIILASSSTTNFYSINIAIDTNYKLCYCLSSTGTSWDIADTALGTTTFTTGSDIYIKAEFTGSAYNFYSSSNGETWTTESTVTSSLPIAPPTARLALGNAPANSLYYRGSIDLDKTYIKVGNNILWSGTTEIKKGFTTEYDHETRVASYGVCGDFVYDSQNNTVRLPKFGDISYTTNTLTDNYKTGTKYYMVVKKN